MAIPETLENVSVKLKANIYFDGKVVSHSIFAKDGSKKTTGLIYPGSFHFNTDAPERMDILAGNCRVLLKGEQEWKNYDAGSFFKVAGKSAFDIAVDSGITEYLCTFE